MGMVEPVLLSISGSVVELRRVWVGGHRQHGMGITGADAEVEAVMRKTSAINGDEHDWTTGWRRWLCVFRNNTGIGKRIKRAMNKRCRRAGKREAEEAAHD